MTDEQEATRELDESSDTESAEELLTNPDEIWFRHAFPAAATEDRGEINQLAFKLHDNDGGKLSGARSSKVSAASSFDERRTVKPNTAGTWGVSIGELDSCGLRCVDDTAVPPPKPTGHSYVDLRRVTEDRAKDLRQELADFANDRGRLHP